MLMILHLVQNYYLYFSLIFPNDVQKFMNILIIKLMELNL